MCGGKWQFLCSCIAFPDFTRIARLGILRCPFHEVFRMQTIRTSVLPVVCGALLGLGGLTGGDPALGDDFRVDNVVYAAEQQTPSTETTTIFSGGVVYDYLKSPAETVVFDRTAGRFTLLNLTHQVRAELTTTELATFSDGLQQLAAKNTNPLVKFLAEPKFHEQFDEATGQLTLTSPWVTYRLTLLHETSPSIVEQYHESRDWLARLNTFLLPGSMPPFGRLVVNAALAQHQATASTVVRIVAPGKQGQQPTKDRSEHRLIRSLDAGDVEQVAKTRKLMTSYKLVSFDQYRKTETR
jgi:hypothetical protein